MDSLSAARRLAFSIPRQVADASTRRLLLARLVQGVDVVHVFDCATRTLSPPTLLFLADGTHYHVQDFRLCESEATGWRHFARRFSLDGEEVGVDGAKTWGRLLLASASTPQQSSTVRQAVLERWEEALNALERHSRAEAFSGMPGLLRWINGEDVVEVDVATYRQTVLDPESVDAVRNAIAHAAERRAATAGLGAELTEVAVAQAVREAPLTDGDVAALLSRLPAGLAKRAFDLAETLRQIHGHTQKEG